MRKVLIFLFSVCCSVAWGQGEVSFTAFTDARRVVIDGYFEVSFTLSNADGTKFQPPSFRSFVVVSGPSRSMQRTIVNGKRTMEMSYSYTLQPRKKGQFEIGSASISANGKTLRTKPIKIEVVEGSVSSQNDENAFFVRAIPSTFEAYIGQQVNLNYKLFTTVNIESYNILEEADYSGFYAEDLTRFESRMVREIIDNIQYTSRVLKSVALYPQQTGTLVVEPMQLQLGVVVNDQRRPQSFFFSRPVKRTPASTVPVDIIVRSLPAGAPASFTGAVGEFIIRTGINRKVASTDDVISLKMIVSGDGDMKRVQAPELSFGGQFEVYDPSVQEEETFELRGKITGRKTFEYLIVPKAPGNFELTPEFSYFNPDSAKYITYRGDTYQLQISQGSKKAAPIVSNSGEEETKMTIRPPKTTLKLSSASQHLWNSSLFWLLLLLPVVLLSAIWLYDTIKKRKADIAPEVLRKRQALKTAQRKLEQAKSYLEKMEPRSFYDEVSKAMIAYISGKFELNLSEFSKEKVRTTLESIALDEDVVSRFMKILDNCEMALFAGKDNKEVMKSTYNTALNVLVDIEKKL